MHSIRNVLSEELHYFGQCWNCFRSHKHHHHHRQHHPYSSAGSASGLKTERIPQSQSIVDFHCCAGMTFQQEELTLYLAKLTPMNDAFAQNSPVEDSQSSSILSPSSSPPPSLPTSKNVCVSSW